MDHYTYHFIVNGRVAATGIFCEPRRQKLQDQARWAQGHIQIVGGPMPEMAAMAWRESTERRARAGPGTGGNPRGPARRRVMRIDIRHHRGIVTVTVAGRLDEAAALALHGRMERRIEDAERGLLVDMENITFISSSGLGVILFLAKQLADRRGVLVLYGLPKTVRDVFAVSGFDRLLNIAESREAAMRMVAEAAPEPGPG